MIVEVFKNHDPKAVLKIRRIELFTILAEKYVKSALLLLQFKDDFDIIVKLESGNLF